MEEKLAEDIVPNLMHLRHVGQMQEKSLDRFNCRVRSSHNPLGNSQVNHCMNLVNDKETPEHKWKALFAHQSWVIIDFKGVQNQILGVGFKSADDEPMSDPDLVRVLVQDDTSMQWIHVATFDMDFSEKRFMTLKYRIPAVKTSAICFDFENRKAKEIHLSQIHVYQ